MCFDQTITMSSVLTLPLLRVDPDPFAPPTTPKELGGTWISKGQIAAAKHGREQEVGARLQRCATDALESSDLSAGGPAGS